MTDKQLTEIEQRFNTAQVSGVIIPHDGVMEINQPHIDFFNHAPADIAALLAEVRRLQAEVRRLNMAQAYQRAGVIAQEIEQRRSDERDREAAYWRSLDDDGTP